MLMDKVKCCMCDEVSIVERWADDCPMCNKTGYLMDIEQEIEV